MSEADVERTINERLAARGQRYTTGRRRIVDTLTGASTPLTLPQLLARQPALSQSSAYRNLAVMEECGVVRRLVHGADRAHFELAEDLTGHHHHLVCGRCGDVRDVTLDRRLERSLDTAFDALAAAAGFEAHRHTLDIHGTCSRCRV